MTDATRPRSSRATAFTAAGVLAGIALVALGGLGFGTATAEAAPAPAAPVITAGPEFPTAWYYIDRGTQKRYALPMSLEGKPAPALKLKDWFGEAVTMKDLRGKIVVVDFWATWCPPCRKALPENVRMVKAYSKDEFAILGIHDARRGHERMAAMAKATGLNYPTAVDDGGFSTKAWKVSFWPTYAVVDHKGIVRAAGLYPHNVKDVVNVLLEELRAESGVSAP